MPLPVVRAVLPLLPFLLALGAYAREEDVELWQANIVKANGNLFHTRQAHFTSDFIFSFVNARPAADDDTGQLQNFEVGGTSSINDVIIDLQEVDPVDMSFEDGHFAVSFGSPNSIYLAKDLSTELRVKLPYDGGRPVVAGQVHIMKGKNFLTVFEYELVTHPLPDFATNNIHVYSFETDALVLKSTISPDDGFGKVVSALPPSGAFQASNSSRFYASDGYNLVFIIGIDDNGVARIEATFDHPLTDIHIRQIAPSPSGRLLALLDGDGVSLMRTADNSLEYQSGSLWTLVASVCWSPGDLYVVVGGVYRNTLILDVANNKTVLFNDTLPGSEFESFFCSFSPSSGLFVMDSLKQGQLGKPPEHNLTTYHINAFPDELSVDGQMVPLPSMPPKPGAIVKPPATTSPEPTGGDGACFPESAKVELEGGSFVSITDVRLGDRVRSGPTSFSRVILWGHRDTKTVAVFVTLDLLNEKSSQAYQVSLSPKHFVPVEGHLVTADSVRVGATLRHGVSGEALKVTGVWTSPRRGLYNPHTLDGSIVIDDILVSTYTAAIDPRLAHFLLSVLRWASELLPRKIWEPISLFVGHLVEASPRTLLEL